MIVARSAGLSAPLCLVAALALCPSSATAQSAETPMSSESLTGDEADRSIKLAAEKTWGGGGGSSRGFSGSGEGGSVRSYSRSRGGTAAPSRRFVAPGGGSMAKSRAGNIRTPRQYVVPRAQRIRPQTGRRAPSRIVVPRQRPTLSVTPKTRAKGLRPLPRFKLQATRKAPVTLGLVNRGWRTNPGWSKPPGVAHNPGFKAGKSGWMHRHRPFYFKRDGHRWRRHYYTYLVGGLWYWYWYDVIADTDPAAIAYPEVILPECDPDDDECVEPSLIAPALLEGRATQAAIDRCAAEFASFNPETGTYVRSDGEVEVCPYLE